jgi:hypothetical protein
MYLRLVRARIRHILKQIPADIRISGLLRLAGYSFSAELRVCGSVAVERECQCADAHLNRVPKCSGR